MSNEKKGYLGKDGRRYNDLWEVWNADTVVENNEKQTRLLQQQQQLLLLQMEQKEKEMAEAKKQEIARQEHEKQLAQEKYDHQKEVLMLKTFDELSIPIAIYEKFEDKLLKTEANKEDAIKLLELTTSVTKMTAERFSKSKDFSAQIDKNANYTNNEVKYSDKYKKFEDFINSKIMLDSLKVKDFDIIQENKELIELFNQTKKNTENLLYMSKIICYVVGILLIIQGLFFWGLIILGMAILLTNSEKVKIPIPIRARTELKDKINASISKQMLEEYQQSNVSEEEKAMQDEMKELQTKMNENSKKIIDVRLEELYNFRLEHYNIKIEKLFYDIGLVNTCIEKDYNWLDIDKNNIKKEGSYEDYFHYFNNYNPEN